VRELEYKNQRRYDSGQPEAHLALNGQNIPFVIHVKYLDVIHTLDKRPSIFMRDKPKLLIEGIAEGLNTSVP
jgi:hypothetical protein